VAANKKHFKNFLYHSTPSVLGFSFNVFLIPFAAHYLGLAQIGILTSLLITNSIFLAVLDFHLQPIMISWSKEKDVGTLFSLYLKTKVILVSLSTLGIVAYITFFLESSLERTAILILYFSALITPFQFDWVFISKDIFKKLSFYKNAQVFVQLASIFVFVQLYPSIITIALCMLVSNCFIMLFLLKHLAPYLKNLSKSTFPQILKLLKSAAPLASLQLIAPFGIYFGVVLLQQQLGTSDILGAYAIGQRIALAPIVLSYSAVMVFMSSLNTTSNSQLVFKSFFKILALSTPGLILIELLAPFFFTNIIYPYISTDPTHINTTILVFRILFLGVFANICRAPFSAFFLIKRYTLYYFLIHSLPIGACFILMYMAGKAHNIKGIAMAATSSEILISLIFIVYFTVTKIRANRLAS